MENVMQDSKWTDERVIAALGKSSRAPMVLNSKSRSKVQRALFEENARLREQNKPSHKPRRGITALFAALSNN